MKKLFALFITLLLFSCSTEEDGNNSMDPLIGVWEAIEYEYYDEPDENGITGRQDKHTLTVNSELLISEVLTQYSSMRTASVSTSNETSDEWLCNRGYDIVEYTWRNLGDDYTRQEQTYEVVLYSTCGVLEI